MTHRTIPYILLGGMLLFFSCNGRRQPVVNPDDATQIEVGIEEGEDDAFDALLEDVRFVPLETSDEVLIGEIEKIVCYDSEYYVADKGSNGGINSIYRFDPEGRFLNRIGLRGRGPNEYIDPVDFIVDSSGVTVLDLRRFLFYDHAGSFKKDVRLPYILYEITGMPDENLIFAVAGDNRDRPEAKDYETLILDTEGNLISGHIPRDYVMNFRSNKKSFLYDGKVIYSRPFKKYIYSVDRDGAAVEYVINIRDSPLPDDYEEKCRGDFRRFRNRYEDKYNYFVGNLLENDDVVFFITESKEHQHYWNVYNKRTGEVHTGLDFISKVSSASFNARSMILGGLDNYLLTGNDGDIIGSIGASAVGFDHGGHRDGFPSLANVEEGDNPVIFHFRFKR